METSMTVRGCILGDGRSIRAVARETGISRTTIEKYLKDQSNRSIGSGNRVLVTS